MTPAGCPWCGAAVPAPGPCGESCRDLLDSFGSRELPRALREPRPPARGPVRLGDLLPALAGFRRMP